MLARPDVVGEVVGTLLEPQHFHVGAFRVLYEAMIDAYYADDPIDPLSIGTLCAKRLTRVWNCSESEAVAQVDGLAENGRGKGKGVDHAKLVKRYADYRSLLRLSSDVEQAVRAEAESPDEIAGLASQTAMQIATSTLLTHELLTYEKLGQRFVAKQRKLMAARAQGIELGAYFGLSFIDNFTRGLQPTELMFVAGEPGAGKSAVVFEAAQGFAARQLRKPSERRVGALVLSLEMGEEPTADRLAQAATGIDGGKIREGRTDSEELGSIIERWGSRKTIPLVFNFSSTMRSTQMRAVIVEAIRRYNVGLVVVDHMRYFDMEGRFQNQIEEEEAKARFLKENIAKDLNVAVICLAHTNKALGDDGRPGLRDMRGSYMVAAHADFVAFVYRPYLYASQDDILEGRVSRSDAEMIWAKNRHGLQGTARFHFDASKMEVR